MAAKIKYNSYQSVGQLFGTFSGVNKQLSHFWHRCDFIEIFICIKQRRYAVCSDWKVCIFEIISVSFSQSAMTLYGIQRRKERERATTKRDGEWVSIWRNIQISLRGILKWDIVYEYSNVRWTYGYHPRAVLFTYKMPATNEMRFRNIKIMRLEFIFRIK